ncbi:MAG: DNA-directed RNA polymerase subunit D [DPANN group archaeon]|nr:DNA-directed RNA polymerase subunit D [DPANN group archaeon]
MDIKIIEKQDNILKFEVTDISPAFANMIRRNIISKVQTLTIEDVDVVYNTSALYDEILAHKLGLIPLNFNTNDYVNKKDCKCENGCEKCQVTFILKKTGPCNVYAKDLKSTDPNVFSTDGDIIIVKLLENQEIYIEMRAILGSGNEHSKWTGGIVGYKYFPTLTRNKDCKKCGACVKACPKGAIGEDFKLNPYKCDLDKTCVNACPNNALSLESDQTHIIFIIESISGLNTEELVLSAIDITKKNLSELKAQIK